MKEKIRKCGSILSSFLWLAMTGILILVLVNVSMDKLDHRIPDICGYSIFRISTGSMEPAIPAGMYVLVQKTEPEKIQTGDIITFYSEDPDIYNYPNTHRVVSKRLEESGTYLFETRGDANYINDKLLVPEQRLIGRVLLNLTELTDFVEFFMTRTMLILLLSMQFLCVVMAIYFNKMKKASKAQAEQDRQKLIEQLTQKEVERLIREAEAKKQAEKDASSGEENRTEAVQKPEQKEET